MSVDKLFDYNFLYILMAKLSFPKQPSSWIARVLLESAENSYLCVCVCVCVRACVRACVGGWVGVCACVRAYGELVHVCVNACICV